MNALIVMMSRDDVKAFGALPIGEALFCKKKRQGEPPTLPEKKSNQLNIFMEKQSVLQN